MAKFDGLTVNDFTRIIDYYKQKNNELEISFLVLQIEAANKEKEKLQSYYNEKDEIMRAHKKEIQDLTDSFNKKIIKLESEKNKTNKIKNEKK